MFSSHSLANFWIRGLFVSSLSFVCMSLALMGFPMAAYSGGFERGGTDAELLLKLEPARKLARDVLNEVTADKLIDSHRLLRDLFTEENRLRMHLDLIAESSAVPKSEKSGEGSDLETKTKKYRTQILFEKPENVFVVAKDGTKILKIAATEFVPYSPILISDAFGKSSSVDALGAVILHELVHHLGIRDEIVEIDGRSINKLDALAIELLRIFHRMRGSKDTDHELKEELFRLRNQMEALVKNQPSRVNVNNLPPGDRTSYETTLAQIKNPRLQAERGGRRTLNQWVENKLFVPSDLLGIGDYLAKARNAYCTGKDLAELKVFFDDMNANSDRHRETYRDRPIPLVTDVIEEYNRRLQEKCPAYVVEACTNADDRYDYIGFSAEAGQFGYIVELAGPIVSFGVGVKHEYTGPDEGRNHIFSYEYSSVKFDKTMDCYLTQLDLKRSVGKL